MKKTVAILICLLGCTLHAQQLKTEAGTWEEILAIAAKERKLIFLTLSKNKCPECAPLHRKIFSDPTTSEYFNRHFLNVSLHYENIEGRRLAAKYKAFYCPTLLFIDRDGKLIHASFKVTSAEEMLALGRTANTPELTRAGLEQAFDRNPASYDLAKKVIAHNTVTRSANTVALKFLNAIPRDSMLRLRNWRLMNHYLSDVYSEPFVYLLDHRGAFAASFGEKPVNEKIYEGYMSLVRSELTLLKNGKKNRYTELRAELDRLNFPRADELKREADMLLSRVKEDQDTYYTTGLKQANSDKYKDHSFLAGFAWKVGRSSNDKGRLAEAEKLAARACQLKSYSWYYFVYGDLLSRNGKEIEAEKVKRKAQELGKEDGGLDVSAGAELFD